MKIGESIKAIREREGMSQEEFAKLYSVTRQTISNWENEKSYPDLQTLVDISDKFDISLDVLLRDDKEMVKKVKKDQKFSKKIKVLMCLLLLFVIIVPGIWIVIWGNQKKKSESKFNEGLAKYNFMESTEDDAYQYPYIMKDNDGTVYKIDSYGINPWYQPSFGYNSKGLWRSSNYHNRGILTSIRQNGELKELYWYYDDQYVKRMDVTEVTVSDSTGYRRLSDDDIAKMLTEDESIKRVKEKVEEMGLALFDVNESEDLDEAVNDSSKTLSEGDMAPDFSAVINDGTTVKLSEQSGKVVLLNFWATWCGPCIKEMPALEKLNGEYEGKALIMAVDCSEDRKTVDLFVSEYGYTLPIAYDQTGEITSLYPNDGIPYTLIIGKDGVIKRIFEGAGDADEQYEKYKIAIEGAF